LLIGKYVDEGGRCTASDALRMNRANVMMNAG